MARKPSNLRKFLKNEVQKAKIKPPEPDPLPCTTVHGSRPHLLTQDNLSSLGHGRNSLSEENIFSFSYPPHTSSPQPAVTSPALLKYSDVNSLFGDSDTDSLFGETLNTSSAKSQAQLEQLLARGTSKSPRPLFSESSNLRELRQELKTLVVAETGGNMTDRELSLVERRKGPLVEEIRHLEEAERMAFEAIRTAKTQALPEPLGHFEKKRMAWNMKRLEKAKAKTEVSKKRSRADRENDNDNDLDGEDFLRATGRSRTKPKPLKTTGHFKSTIHDYFPGLPGAKKIRTEFGDVVTIARTLRDYSVEERKLRRRELAELGEALAKEERRMKR